MTPLDCSQGIKEYLEKCFKSYQENTTNSDGTKTSEQVPVYHGFLPRCTSVAAMKKLCPAVVVHYDKVDDGKDDTQTGIIIYAAVFDDDQISGVNTLYHLLEFIRYVLLGHNPIDNKWRIVDDVMQTTIPDEQPYPQWIGAIEFNVYLPQPQWNNSKLLRGEYLEK